MNESLQQFLTTVQPSATEIRRKTDQVFQSLLHTSPYIDAANFSRIHDRDLRTAFDLYDGEFFQGQLARVLGERPLHFRWSSRMTRVGGHTVRVRTWNFERYEIALSAPLLFNSCADPDSPVLVNGLPCRTRLAAMLRVFEHELVHLAEMLAWDDSSCARRRFRAIAERLFGHRDHHHQLVTHAERAASQFGIRPGDRVTFRFDGREYQGKVNRVNKRATVLVEDPTGLPYSDGKRYRKFYVPLPLLRHVEAPKGRLDSQ